MERGGCEMHLTHVLPRLDPTEFDVRLFLLYGRGALADHVIQSGLTVHAPIVSGNFISLPVLSVIWKIIFTSYLLARLLAHFVVFRPHIVHFFLPAAYLIGLPIAVLSGIKVRVMSRRSLNNYQRKSMLLSALAKLERTFHQSVDYILGNSRAVVQQLIDDEGVPVKKAKLIYNGITLPPPKEDKMSIRNQWGIGDHDVMIVVVANLIAYKGHADLIEALAFLKSKKPYKCVMIGYDSGIQSTLEMLAHKRNVRDHIIFTGSRNNVTDFYHAADLSILCSHEEGFSNTILEAMSAGLPLVVTNVGGNSEAVTDEENGLVVAPHNPKELGKAIDRLIKSETLRHRFGAISKDIIKKKFTLEACVSQYEDFYKKVAQKSHGKANILLNEPISCGMNRSPKISVILPVYNTERYLREAVDSILTQTFTDFELILINDGSTDRSGDICREYAGRDPRIVLIDRPNGGLASALNDGIAKARAPLIARMDADDIAMPERFACQYAHMMEHPQIAVLGSAIQWINETGEVTTLRSFPTTPREIEKSIVFAHPVAHPAVIMQKSAVLKAGGYRAAFMHAEDYELWLRVIALGYDIANLPQPLLNYRIHREMVSIEHRKQQLLSQSFAVLSDRTRQAGYPDPLTGVEELHGGLLQKFPDHLRSGMEAFLFLGNHTSLIWSVLTTDEKIPLFQVWKDYLHLEPQIKNEPCLCKFLLFLAQASVHQKSWVIALQSLIEALYRNPKTTIQLLLYWLRYKRKA